MRLLTVLFLLAGGALVTAQPIGKWQPGKGVSPLDDSVTHMTTLRAEEMIKAGHKDIFVGLIARCKDGKVELMMGGPSLQYAVERDDVVTVRLRLDQQPPTTEQWTKDRFTREAIFAPRAPGLLQQMMDAETLRLEFAPFNAPPVVVRFDVRGLRESITPIAHACQWEP